MPLDRDLFHPDYVPEPYWWQDARPGTEHSADLPNRTEILIIGSGYAGWGAGQLDREIQDESWWLGPLDELLLLDLDYEIRWERTMDNLGFDQLTTTFSQTGMV